MMISLIVAAICVVVLVAAAFLWRLTARLKAKRGKLWDQTKIDEQFAARDAFLSSHEDMLITVGEADRFLADTSHPADYYHPARYKSAFYRILGKSELREPAELAGFAGSTRQTFREHNMAVWSQLAEEALNSILDHADSTKYVSRSELQAALIGRHSEPWRELNATDFLERHDINTPERATRVGALLAGLKERHGEHNDAAVQQTLSKYRELFDTAEAFPLTEAQRVAVVTDEDANLVVAGAGTGKTSVVTARVLYLLDAGLAEPHEILVLAYNRKAAAELTQRISAKLGSRSPEISTFHAKGLRTLRQVGNTDVKLTDLDQSALVTWMVKWLIDHLGDQRTRDRIMSFTTMFGYIDAPKSDMDVAGDFQTLAGYKVKSLQEKHIADWMTLNRVWNKYELRYQHLTSSDYYPDWTLDQNHRTYLEHFGIDRNGQTHPNIDAEKYNKWMQWKRDIHRYYDTRLLETYSYQFSEGTWQVALERQLSEARLSRLGAPQDWLQNSSFKRYLHSAARLLATFLTLHKNTGRELAEVEAAVSKLPAEHSQYRARVFLGVYRDVYDAYQRRLLDDGEIDFADMCNRATQAMQAMRLRGLSLPYKHILIDEFQDITRSRAMMIKQLLRMRKYSRLFAVGDDWQSIYRFAGSEIDIMTEEFEDHFGLSAQTHLDRAFRYTPSIEKVSSTFIQKNKSQIRKEVTAVAADEVPGVIVKYYDPEVINRGRWVPTGPDTLERALREAIDDIASQHKGDDEPEILALARQNAWLDKVRRFARLGTKLRLSTVHSAKGTEADYVIVIGLKDGRSSFPSNLSDDPVLELLRKPGRQGYPFAEERRLFYVALTRARKRVYLLTDRQEPSPFVRELIGQAEERDLQIMP